MIQVSGLRKPSCSNFGEFGTNPSSVKRGMVIVENFNNALRV